MRMILHVPDSYRRLFAAGFAAALVVLSLGAVCLLADIGRVDRIVLLMTQPTVSFIAVGAWALAACAVLAVLLGLAWGGYARWGDTAVRALEVAMLLAALAVMTYTGLLLQSLEAVPLWATPWLSVLFVLSSLSCGIALVLGAAQLTGAARAFGMVLGRLAAVDAIVIAVEAIVVVLLVATAGAAGSQTGAVVATGTSDALAASVRELVAGTDAWLFWGGFAGVGLAVPFVLDIALARLRRPMPLVALAAAACVLIGGFVIRFCIVEAGMHPTIAAMPVG